MLYLHISYRKEFEHGWEDLHVSRFQSFGKMYPEEQKRKDSYSIDKEISTPRGESFNIAAYFSSSKNLINYQFMQNGTILLSNSSYKKNLESFDPSVNLRLPNGDYMAITFSSLKDVETL